MLQESVEGMELTEELVLTRTRAPDLESVKKLNCWASHIKDVQVVRRMPNLEVCSLSINHITSLRDFAHCHKLKELYVRTNNIQQLGDIHYLKSLPKLRSLWLSENPCANTPNYRSTVLRSLPNLQKLDNRVVSPQEVEVAVIEGDEIPVPADFSSSSIFTCSLNDTHTSVSSSFESGGVARKKREQRRQRIAAEEAARKSQEEESSDRSRSEEEQSNSEKSDDVTRWDSDTGWQGPGAKEDFFKHGSVGQSLPSSLASLEIPNDEVTHGNERLELEEQCIDESQIEACEDESKEETKNGTNSHSDEKNVLTEDPGDENRESLQEENNNAKKDDCAKESIETEANDSFEVDRDKEKVKGLQEMSRNPLLDKIRLNDSLNCADSQDVVESIALDDLVIELAVETESNNIRIEKEDNIDRNEVNVSTKDEREEAKTEELCAETCSVQSESYGEDEAKQSTVAGNKDGVKNGVVDWDEHNRLRAELGVKQIERTTLHPCRSDVNRIRNSNILQAVLSLVKELDKDSLDIVSMAVQSRLEKL